MLFVDKYDLRITFCLQHHRKEPFILETGGNAYSVKYEPGESESNMFGGNSNWRGPIWLPSMCLYCFFFISVSFCAHLMK